MESVSLKYFRWQFYKQPAEILRGLKNYLAFNVYLFSAPDLLKSLFSPWKRELSSYGRGFDFKVYLESAAGNLISRLIGFILRLFLLISFAAAEILSLAAGIVLFLIWIALPFLALGGIIYGLIIIF
ncbi:MAG: hypothetical protein PHG23_01140 [Candidatus Pacebacteria bacterium]|nr:hypothetical protein [Candidatus Paceibacterota bacterium]